MYFRIPSWAFDLLACFCSLLTMNLQGASKPAVQAYKQMATTPEFQNPLSWSSPDFSLDSYNLIFLPGGHEKSVRQLIDSPIIHKHLATYFPATQKPSTKSVAAVCHGVMVLSETEGADGKSIIHECVTTALPTRFEQIAFWGTRAFLGDYYKTYGAGSDNVEESVSMRDVGGAYMFSDCGSRFESVSIILKSNSRPILA